MEHNIEVMEGTRFPLCVKLQDGEGNALAGDGFRVYGGAVCPGMAAVAFPVTRSGGEFVVMVPGLAVGRMPWRYQVFVVEQATGVEWLLVSGEVRPEARCADASGGVAAGSLTVTGVLDKQTLSMGVQLGESTELCRSLVARAEEAARRAEEAAAGASFTLTAEEVQKVVPMKWGGMVGASDLGPNALVFGENAKAIGSAAVAFGYGASASGFHSVVLGTQASSKSGLSVAVGDTALTLDSRCIAVGDSAKVSRECGVAIGSASKVGGVYGVALGYGASAEDTGCIAQGKDARVTGHGGVGIGGGVLVSFRDGVAIGTEAEGSGEEALSLGRFSRGSGSRSVAVGAGAVAEHAGAFVLGIDAVSKNAGEMTLKATNPAEGTSVSLSFMAGKATGYDEDMWSPSRFMDDTKVKLTVRDELSGLQHSVAVSLSLLMYHLKTELQGVSEFGVVEGDGYGYGY